MNTERVYNAILEMEEMISNESNTSYEEFYMLSDDFHALCNGVQDNVVQGITDTFHYGFVMGMRYTESKRVKNRKRAEITVGLDLTGKTAEDIRMLYGAKGQVWEVGTIELGNEYIFDFEGTLLSCSCIVSEVYDDGDYQLTFTGKVYQSTDEI